MVFDRKIIIVINNISEKNKMENTNETDILKKIMEETINNNESINTTILCCNNWKFKNCCIVKIFLYIYMKIKLRCHKPVVNI